MRRLVEPRLQRAGLRLGADLALAPRGGVGGDGGETALGQFDLARQRLRLGPHLGEAGAIVGDPGAHGGEIGGELIGGRQLGERGGGFFAGRAGLGKTGGEPRLRLGQRRAPRGQAVDLALGGGMPVARRVGLALQLAAAVARGRLRLGGGGDLRFGGSGGGAAGFELRAGDGEFGLDIGEAIAFGEPARRAGRRVGGGGKAVPAPQIALAGDEPLAGLQKLRQPRAVGAAGDADLGQPAPEFARRLGDVAGERLDALGQRRIGRVGFDAAPMHRRGQLDRSVEIVAQRGAERGLEALLDGEQIDHRRPQVLDVDLQHLGQRLRLGLQAVDAPLRLGERLTHDVERLTGAGLRRLGAQRRRLRLADRGLRGGDGGGEPVNVDLRLGLGDQPVELGGDGREFRLEASLAIFVLAGGAGELVALGGEVGQRRGEFGEGLFGGGQRAVRRGDTRLDPAAAFGGRGRLALQRLAFGGELGQRRLRIRRQRVFAGDVLGQLDEAPVEFGHALPGARLLAIERLAGDHEALQRGGGLGFGVAQRRQRRGGDRLLGRRFRLRAGAGGDFADADVLGMLGVGDFLHRRDVTQMKQRRLGLAHLLGDSAVAHGLAGLALEPIDLLGELADHVLEAGEVLLGGAQPQLGLVAAGVQAGNAGGFFQHAAALLGLGLDDLADAALVDEGGRARAGRGVGEQDLDVAGAHFAAVDAIGRALLALDAARDFERLFAVELGRRGAIGIVDRHRDFGVVARRPVVVAGEDDVVHVGGAHGLVRGLAHHPAQRLDQVRLAAAVRADHAGQSRLDQKIGRLDERLEADEA